MDGIDAGIGRLSDRYFSKDEIQKIEKSIHSAFSKLTFYSGMPDNMYRDYQVILSLSPWVKHGLYFTGDGVTLVFNASIIDNDVQAFQHAGLADDVNHSEAPVAIILHQLSLVLFERLRPDVFWREFSASQDDSVGCQPLRHLTSVPEVLEDKSQAVSPLAQTSGLDFFAETLAAILLHRVVPPMSLAALDRILNQTTIDDVNNNKVRQALYYGWRTRLEAIKTGMVQNRLYLQLKSILEQGNNWNNQGDIQILASGEGSGTRYYQVTSTINYTLVQDFETGKILEFTEYNPEKSAMESASRRRRAIDREKFKSVRGWAGDLTRGETAIQESGVPADVVEAWQNVARENNALIAVRPVNLDTSDLLEKGLGEGIEFVTKGLNIKGKSSDWGLQSGLIPFDSALSKVLGKNGFENRSDIEKGNAQNFKSIKLPELTAAPLLMSLDAAQRRLNQGKIDSLERISNLEYRATSTRTIEGLAESAPRQEIRFEYRLTKASGGLWAVEYKSTDYSDKDIDFNVFRPLTVLAEAGEDGKSRLFTADVDLFALFRRVSDAVDQSSDAVFSEVEKISKDLLDSERMSQQARARWRSAIERVKLGLGQKERRSFDEIKGRLTHFQEDIVHQLNQAVRDVNPQYPKLVHHGTEQDNTDYPEQDAKILFIDPDGKVFQTKQFDQVPDVFKYYEVEKNFLTYVNRSYQPEVELQSEHLENKSNKIIFRRRFYLNELLEVLQKGDLPDAPRLDIPTSPPVFTIGDERSQYKAFGHGYITEQDGRHVVVKVYPGEHYYPVLKWVTLLFDSDAYDNGVKDQQFDLTRLQDDINAIAEMFTENSLYKKILKTEMSGAAGEPFNIKIFVRPDRMLLESRIQFKGTGTSVIELGFKNIEQTPASVSADAISVLLGSALLISVPTNNKALRKAISDEWRMVDPREKYLNRQYGLDGSFQLTPLDLGNPVYQELVRDEAHSLKVVAGREENKLKVIDATFQSGHLSSALNRIHADEKHFDIGNLSDLSLSIAEYYDALTSVQEQRRFRETIKTKLNWLKELDVTRSGFKKLSADVEQEISVFRQGSIVPSDDSMESQSAGIYFLKRLDAENRVAVWMPENYKASLERSGISVSDVFEKLDTLGLRFKQCKQAFSDYTEQLQITKQDRPLVNLEHLKRKNFLPGNTLTLKEGGLAIPDSVRQLIVLKRNESPTDTAKVFNPNAGRSDAGTLSVVYVDPEVNSGSGFSLNWWSTHTPFFSALVRSAYQVAGHEGTIESELAELQLGVRKSLGLPAETEPLVEANRLPLMRGIEKRAPWFEDDYSVKQSKVNADIPYERITSPFSSLDHLIAASSGQRIFRLATVAARALAGEMHDGFSPRLQAFLTHFLYAEYQHAFSDESSSGRQVTLHLSSTDAIASVLQNEELAVIKHYIDNHSLQGLGNRLFEALDDITDGRLGVRQGHTPNQYQAMKKDFTLSVFEVFSHGLELRYLNGSVLPPFQLPVAIGDSSVWQPVQSGRTELIFHRHPSLRSRIKISTDSSKAFVLVTMDSSQEQERSDSTHSRLQSTPSDKLALLQGHVSPGEDAGVTRAFLDNVKAAYEFYPDGHRLDHLDAQLVDIVSTVKGVAIEGLAKTLLTLVDQEKKTGSPGNNTIYTRIANQLIKPLTAHARESLTPGKNNREVLKVLAELMTMTSRSSIAILMTDETHQSKLLRVALNPDLDLGGAVLSSEELTLGTLDRFTLRSGSGYVIKNNNEQFVDLVLTGKPMLDTTDFPEVRLIADRKLYKEQYTRQIASNSLQSDVEYIAGLNAEGQVGGFRRLAQLWASEQQIELSNGRPVDITLRPDLTLEQSFVVPPESGSKSTPVKLALGLSDRSQRAGDVYEGAFNHLFALAAYHSQRNPVRLTRVRHSFDVLNRPVIKKIAIDGSDSRPPREVTAVSPIGRFLNDKLFGSRQERRTVSPLTSSALIHSEHSSKAITLQGQAGRLKGYYHLANGEPSPETKVILFLHGADFSCEEQLEPVRKAYQEREMDVLAVNYRGFGQSDGAPSERGVYQDARTMLAYLMFDRKIDPGRIVIHGYSLGAAVGADLVAYAEKNNQPVSGLILDRPMASLHAALKEKQVSTNPLVIKTISAFAGKFNTFEKLNKLTSKIRLLLYTDADESGSSGEVLRETLLAKGFEVEGEVTHITHDQSDLMMERHGDAMASFARINHAAEHTPTHVLVSRPALNTPWSIIEYVWSLEPELLQGEGRRVGLDSQLGLVFLPDESGRDLYKRLVQDGKHDLVIRQGSVEDFTAALYWLADIEPERSREIGQNILRYVEANRSDPAIASFAKALITIENNPKLHTIRYKYYAALGSGLYKQLSTLEQLDSDDKNRFERLKERAGSPFVSLGDPDVVEIIRTPDQTLYTVRKSSDASVQTVTSDKGNQFTLETIEPIPSTTKLFQADGEKAVPGTPLDIICRRTLSGRCSYTYIKQESLKDRFIIDGESTNSAQFDTYEYLQYEGSVYRITSQLTDSVFGINSEEKTVVEAHLSIGENQSVFPLVELPADVRDQIKTFLVDTRSKFIYQLFKDYNKAVLVFPGESVLTLKSETGEVTELVGLPARVDQGRDAHSGVGLGIQRSPRVEFLRVDTPEQVDSALSLSRELNRYGQGHDQLLSMPSSSGMIGVYINSPVFNEGGKFGRYLDLFKSLFKEFLNKSKIGMSLKKKLLEHPKTIARPETFRELDNNLSDEALPKQLKLLIVLETPEQLLQRESRITRFDSEAAGGKKPAVSGSFITFYTGPEGRRIGSDAFFISHFSEVLIDFLAASAGVFGLHRSMANKDAPFFKHFLLYCGYTFDSSTPVSLQLENNIRKSMFDDNNGHYLLSPDFLDNVEDDADSFRLDSEYRMGVVSDSSPLRMGFEIEYYDYTIQIDKKSNQKGIFLRHPMLVTKNKLGVSKKYSLLQLSTDSYLTRSCLELISGPLPITRYQSKGFYIARKTIESVLNTIPLKETLSLSATMDLYNTKLREYGEPIFNDYRFYMSNKASSDIKITRMSKKLGQGVHTNIGFDYAALGDPFSMFHKMVSSNMKSFQSSIFKVFQIKGRMIAKEVMSNPSPYLVSFWTDYLYHSYLIVSDPVDYDEGKEGKNFILRIGLSDVVVSILSDSDILAIKQYFHKKGEVSLLTKITQEIIKPLLYEYQGDKAVSDIERNKKTINARILEMIRETFVDAISVREKYGRIALFSGSDNDQTYLFPLGRSLLEINSVNQPSRIPVVKRGEQYFTVLEIRSSRHPFASFSSLSPEKSELGVNLSLLQTPDAFGHEPSVTRLLIDKLEEIYAGIGKQYHSVLTDILHSKLLKLDDTGRYLVENLLVKIGKEAVDLISKLNATGPLDLLSLLTDYRVNEIYESLHQNKPISPAAVMKLMEFNRLANAMNVNLESLARFQVPVFFSSEKSGFESAILTSRQKLSGLSIGVRDDLAFTTSGEHYKVIFDNDDLVTIKIYTDVSTSQTVLPKTSLVIPKKRYRQAFAARELRPKQLQNDVDAIVTQLSNPDLVYKLRTLHAQPNSKLDMNTGRGIVLELRPDKLPIESNIRLFGVENRIAPVKIQVGMKGEQRRTVFNVLKKMYPIALAASYSQSNLRSGSPERRLVNGLWNFNDQQLASYGNGVGLNSFHSVVSMPEFRENSLYQKMVAGQNRDLSLKLGSIEDFKQALSILLSTNTLESGLTRAFTVFEQADNKEVISFCTAVAEVYESFSHPGQGDSDKADLLLRAIGKNHLFEMRGASDTVTISGLSRMAVRLSSMEWGRRDLGAISPIYRIKNQAIIVLPSSTELTDEMAGQRSSSYVVETLSQPQPKPKPKQQYTTVAMNHQTFDELPLLFTYKDNAFYITETPSEGSISKEWAVQLNSHGSITPKVKMFEEKDSSAMRWRALPKGNYDRYQLVRSNRNGQLGVKLGQPSEITNRGKWIRPIAAKRLQHLDINQDYNKHLMSSFYTASESAGETVIKLLESLSVDRIDKSWSKDVGQTNDVNLYKEKNGFIYTVKDFGGFEIIVDDDIRMHRLSAEKEVFASLFDQKVGLGIVAPTRNLKGCNGDIVVTFYIPEGLSPNDFDHKNLDLVQGLERSTTPITVIDYILDNEDRSSYKNIINTLDGGAYAIDHEGIFLNDSKQTTLTISSLSRKDFQLFFRNHKIWEKFNHTDWGYFFDKNITKLSPSETKTVKRNFLERIGEVKKRVQKEIGNQSADHFFSKAAEVSALSLENRRKAIYYDVPIPVMLLDEKAEVFAFSQSIDLNRQLIKAESKSNAVASLFTFTDPEFRSVAFYVTDYIRGGTEFETSVIPFLKSVSYSIKQFIGQTEQGRKFNSKVRQLSSQLPKPLNINDIPNLKNSAPSLSKEKAKEFDLPNLEKATLDLLIPENVRILIALTDLSGRNDIGLDRFNGQNGFLTVFMDPVRSQRGRDISDTTALFPLLARQYSGLVPGNDFLSYENSIREQFGLALINPSYTGEIVNIGNSFQTTVVVSDRSVWLRRDNYRMTNQFKMLFAVAESMGDEQHRLQLSISPDGYFQLEMQFSGTGTRTGTRTRTRTDSGEVTDLFLDILKRLPSGKSLLSDVIRQLQQSFRNTLGDAAGLLVPEVYDSNYIESVEVFKEPIEPLLSAAYRSHWLRGFVPYSAWGDPLSGLDLLLPDPEDRRLLSACRTKAEELTVGMFTPDEYVDNIKALFTAFFYQALKSVARANGGDISLGFQPMSGVADWITGALSNNEVRFLHSHLDLPGYKAFTDTMNLAAFRIILAANIEPSILSGKGERLFSDAIQRVFHDALKLRHQNRGAFQLPITPLQGLDQSERWLEPVSYSKTQQLLIKKNGKLFGLVEVDVDAFQRRDNSKPEAVDVYFKLVQKSGICGTKPEASAFVKNLELVFTNVETGQFSLIRDLSSVIDDMSVAEKLLLEWALIKRVQTEETEGIADARSRVGRNKASERLLSWEFQEIARLVEVANPPVEEQLRRVNALASSCETTSIIDMQGQVRRAVETITFDPDMALEASWADTSTRKLVLGGAGANGLFAEAIYKLLTAMLRPHADIQGERLIALTIHGRHAVGQSTQSPVLKVVPGKLDISGKLDRIDAALALARGVDADQSVESSSEALKQNVSNTLHFFQQLIEEGGDVSDIDQVRPALEQEANLGRVSNVSLKDALDRINRQITPDLPPPEKMELASTRCRRDAGSCTTDIVEKAVAALDRVDDVLDDALSDRQVERIKQQYQKSVNAFDDVGASLDDLASEYDDLLGDTKENNSDRQSDIKLNHLLEDFYNKRYISVSAESPADNKALQQKMLTRLLALMTAGELHTIDDAINSALSVYEEAGFGDDVDDIKQQVLANEEVKAILQSMISEDDIHRSNEASRLSEAFRNSAIDRWLQRKGYTESPAFVKLQKAGVKLAGNKAFGHARMGLGGAQGLFGLGQSTATLHNLNRFRDSLPPGAYEAGIAGVAFGYTGSVYGLSRMSHALISQAAGFKDELGVLGAGIRNAPKLVGKNAIKLSAKTSSRMARFAPIAGSIIAIAAGVFALTSSAMAADEARKAGNTGQLAFYAVNAVLDAVGIILDTVSLICEASVILAPIGFLIDVIATFLGLVQMIIGFFAPPTNARQDFDALVKTQAFTDFIDRLAADATEEGYSQFAWRENAQQHLKDHLKTYEDDLRTVRHEVIRELKEKGDKGIKIWDMDDLSPDLVADTTDKADYVVAKGNKSVYGLGDDDQIILDMHQGKASEE